MLPLGEWQQLIAACEAAGCYLFSDEMYRFTGGGVHGVSRRTQPYEFVCVLLVCMCLPDCTAHETPQNQQHARWTAACRPSSLNNHFAL